MLLLGISVCVLIFMFILSRKGILVPFLCRPYCITLFYNLVYVSVASSDMHASMYAIIITYSRPLQVTDDRLTYTTGIVCFYNDWLEEDGPL